MIEFVMNNFTGVVAMVIFIVLSLMIVIFYMADVLSKTEIELESYKRVSKERAANIHFFFTEEPSDGFINVNYPEKEGYYICEYSDLNTGETLKGVLYFDNGNGKWMDPKNDFRYQKVFKYKPIYME